MCVCTHTGSKIRAKITVGYYTQNNELSQEIIKLYRTINDTTRLHKSAILYFFLNSISNRNELL